MRLFWLKQLVGVAVVTLGLTSVAWSYSYEIDATNGTSAIFTNDSDSDAIVQLELWYGDPNGNGTTVPHYKYSTDGSSWSDIPPMGDGQDPTPFTIERGGTFYLKFVTQSSADAVIDVNDSSISGDPIYFVYNNGNYNNGNPTGCVAVFTASSVPIPGAAWLLGSGLIGLGIRRRFRKA